MIPLASLRSKKFLRNSGKYSSLVIADSVGSVIAGTLPPGEQGQAMINEEALINILEAADFDDPDDVRIRALLIAALRKSPVDFSGLRRRTNRESGRESGGEHAPPIC